MNEARRRKIARTGGWALTVTGVTLLIIGTAWGSGDSGYVAAAAVNAPIVWSLTVAGGLLVLWSVHSARLGRTPLDVLGWVLAPTALLIAIRFAFLDGSGDGVQRLPSPDGSRTLVVEKVPAILDPLWEVRLETGDGLAGRYRLLGCIDGDGYGYESVRWVDATHVEIVRDRADSFVNRLDVAAPVTANDLDSCTR